MQIPINESRKEKYPKNDFRYHIKKYDNVIEVDLKIGNQKEKEIEKIILDLCGGTGSWTKHYSEKDYDVRIITLPDNDVRTYKPPKNVYGILAASSTLHYVFFCSYECKKT